MDVLKAINSIKNLNSFISLTHDLANKNELSQISLNMSTALALKKIRSFEFEFFSKFQESGLAFMILEHILKLPPSKTWGLLGKELMPVLLYWLEGLRKYLINHCQHWWIFLKSLLKFINELGPKEVSLNTALVEYLAEPLLGLATSEKLAVEQRLRVLRCLNHCSVTCARATRHALADKLAGYFTKIAHGMASCEHVPTQLASTELLLRWLLRRHERAAREAAARRWLPAALFEPPAVARFTQSTFRDFFKDAREFLNAHNEKSDIVTSVVCRKMTIGPLTVISGTEQFPTWLDVNSAHGCVSILLDPQLLQSLDIPGQLSHETLTVTADNAVSVELYRESTEVIISLQTCQAPEVLSEFTAKVLEGLCDVRAHVSSRCDVARLDRALRRAFEGKYRCLLEVDKCVEIISPTQQDFPESSKRFSASEDDTRYFSSYSTQKTVAKRRKRSGYVVKTRRVSGWTSPSTTSTTSLAQLHEKLASLPRLRYDKEPLSVCAPPELSLVAELSEPEDSVSSHRRSRAYGVSQRRRGKARSSPSDAADAAPRRPRDDHHASPPRRPRAISPVDRDRHNTSCLYVATVGSIDDSIINDSREKTNNDIVDLLAREAFVKRDVSETCVVEDSGINTAEDGKLIEAETVEVKAVIENTTVYPFETNKVTSSNKGSKCTIVSKSTSDESNTEAIVAEKEIKPYTPSNKAQKCIETSEDSYPDAISETPRNFVSVRRRNLKKSANVNFDAALVEKASAFNIDDIEEFFSQHFRENKDGDLMISPTLARKINDSSSETSESFDQYLIMSEVAEPRDEFDVDPQDIEDCLSELIDNVCEQFDKCNEFMEKQDTVLDTLEEEVTVPKESKVKHKPAKITRGTPKIKMTYKGAAKKEAKKKATKKRNLQLEPLIEKEPEVSDKDPEVTEAGLEDRHKENIVEEIAEGRNKENIEEEKKSDSDTPLLQRRKRKLYSPKDTSICAVDIENDAADNLPMDEADAIPLAELKIKSNLNTPKQKHSGKSTPKSAATSYKDIETERQKHTKQTRNKRSKVTTPVLSPKTQKNNSLFDKLKENIDDKDLRILDKKSSSVDIAVYNFTSDSEDEDFKKKKIVDLRRSGTTLCSNESRARPRGRGDCTESSVEEVKTSKKASKKAPKKRQPARRKGKKVIEIQKELVDERMRDANPKELNTSFVIENTTEKHTHEDTEVEPVINCAQDMELMEEVVLEEHNIDSETNIDKNKKNDAIAKKTAFDQQKIEIPAKKTSNKEDTKKISKKNSELSLKRNTKDTNRNYTKLTEEHSDESTLPALIIEKTAPRPDDDLRSTTSSNLIKKCNRLIEDGDEFLDDTVATQNMLSDADKICYSPEIQDYPVEIELCDKLNVSKHNESKKAKATVKDIKVTRDDYETNVTENISKPKKDKTKLAVETSVVTVKEVSNTKKTKNKLEIPAIDTIDLETSDSTHDVLGSKYTKLRTFTKKHKVSAVETIDISNHNCASRMTIDTYGTSAIRCESENSPPKTNELTEPIEPRNMELEQLSPSMHEYFLQLRTEITEAPTESPVFLMDNAQKAFGDEEKPGTSRSSPVVRLKKLSDDEFRKWLPSPKSSFNEDPTDETTDLPESTEQPCQILAVKEKKNLDHGGNPCSAKTAKVKKQKVVEKLQSPKSVTSSKIEKINIRDVVKTKPGGKKRADEEPSKKNNPIRKEAKPEVEPKRYSGISPIRLSDDNDADEEVITTVQEKPNYLKKITEIFSQTKTRITTKKYQPRSIENSTDEVSEIVKESSTTSECSRKQQSRKRSLSPQISPSKLRKVQTEATSVVASGASLSSIKEWFTRDIPAKTTAEDVHFACRDCIENVLEKLDTTLIEIHQNTSRKFVNMFVDIQKHQNELEARRAELFAASARQTLTQTVQLVSSLMERQYDQLNDSYKELDTEFKEKMRQLATTLVREDCRQKRAMVTILREDVQAVMEHVGTRRRTH